MTKVEEGRGWRTWCNRSDQTPIETGTLTQDHVLYIRLHCTRWRSVPDILKGAYETIRIKGKINYPYDWVIESPTGTFDVQLLLFRREHTRGLTKTRRLIGMGMGESEGWKVTWFNNTRKSTHPWFEKNNGVTYKLR